MNIKLDMHAQEICEYQKKEVLAYEKILLVLKFIKFVCSKWEKKFYFLNLQI